MAIYYVKNSAAGAANGSSWADAFTTLAAAVSASAAGDTIYVSHLHSESQATALSITFPGTLASPTLVLCANDGATPPTALATTAVVTTTGASNITFGGVAYIYGLTFNCGSAGNAASITLGNSDLGYQRLKACTLALVNTVSSSKISMGSTTETLESAVDLIDCVYSFAHTSQSFNPGRRCAVRMIGGSFTGSALTTIVSSLASAVNFSAEGVDFTGLSASLVPVAGTHAAIGRMDFRNCKMPASWSGSLVASAPTAVGSYVRLHNCSAGDQNYKIREESYAGSIGDETTIVRTGGASDGTTSLAWKMTTSANAEYPLLVLESPEIVIWNDTTGAAKTVTVEIVHDSQGAGSGSKFQDDEIWLEVQYLGTSGYPLGSFVSDAKADVLATAANQADSTETWTTTGLTTPVKQKLSVSFTPQEKGFIHAKVVMAKASKVAYVCPKATVA